MTGEPVRPQPKPKREARPRKPLKRRRPMRKRAPKRLGRAGSDPAYLAWVRTQRCHVASDLCAGTVHAHHAGRRPGVAMKAPDDTAVPLCLWHHACWHNAWSPFERMSKLERFAWSQQAIARTQSEYARREPGTQK